MSAVSFLLLAALTLQVLTHHSQAHYTNLNYLASMTRGAMYVPTLPWAALERQQSPLLGKGTEGEHVPWHNMRHDNARPSIFVPVQIEQRSIM